MPLLSFEDRIKIVENALKGVPSVVVDSFEGLAVDYVKSKKVRIILRGLRMISDFEYEFQMALTNRNLNKEIETIFMMPSEEYSFVSSKLIKEAAALGADLSRFVPKGVEEKLKQKLNYKRGES